MEALVDWQRKLLVQANNKRHKVAVEEEVEVEVEEEEEVEGGVMEVDLVQPVESAATLFGAAGDKVCGSIAASRGLLVAAAGTRVRVAHIHNTPLQTYLENILIPEQQRHTLLEHTRQRIDNIETLWTQYLEQKQYDMLDFTMRKLCAWKLVSTILKANRVKEVKDKATSKYSTASMAGAVEKTLFSKWISYCLTLQAEIDISKVENAPPELQILKFVLANNSKRATEIAMKSRNPRFATIISQGVESFSIPSRKQFVSNLLKLWSSNGTFDLMNPNIASIYASLYGLPDSIRKSSWMNEFAHQVWNSGNDLPMRNIWSSVKTSFEADKKYPELKSLLDIYFVLPAIPQEIKRSIMENCIKESEDFSFCDYSFSWELFHFINRLNPALHNVEVQSMIPELFTRFIEQLCGYGLWKQCFYLISKTKGLLNASILDSLCLKIMSQNLPFLPKSELEKLGSISENYSLKDVYDILQIQRPEFKTRSPVKIIKNTKSHNFQAERPTFPETESLLLSYGAESRHIEISKVSDF